MNVVELCARAIDPACFSPIADGIEGYEVRRLEALERVTTIIDTLAANVTIDMGLAGADEVNKQMRGPGPGADYHAAVDAFRAMLAAAKEQGL